MGEIWPNADKVWKYHFRNLKPKMVTQSYLQYLKTKCEKFLQREVWYEYDDVHEIIDDCIVIPGQNPNYDFFSDGTCEETKFEDACSSSNHFIRKYFDLLE